MNGLLIFETGLLVLDFEFLKIIIIMQRLMRRVSVNRTNRRHRVRVRYISCLHCHLFVSNRMFIHVCFKCLLMLIAGFFWLLEYEHICTFSVLWCKVLWWFDWQMAIIFNEDGLADVDPPCVVQSFINHNARMFKIFIVGPRHFVVQRPSIHNFYPRGLHSVIFCTFRSGFSTAN